MVGGVLEVVRAIGDAVAVHVVVLVSGITVVVMVLASGAVVVATCGIGSAGVGEDGGYQEGEQQEEGKKSTHKIRSFWRWIRMDRKKFKDDLKLVIRSTFFLLEGMLVFRYPVLFIFAVLFLIYVLLDCWEVDKDGY